MKNNYDIVKTSFNIGKSFETKRIINKKFSEVKSYTKLTIKEILEAHNSNAKIDVIVDLIKRIDNSLLDWKKIINIPEYRIFLGLYFTLTDFELNQINSMFVSSSWNIFDEFRKKFLKEKILVSLKWKDKKYLKKYLSEYKNIDLKMDEGFLFEWLEEDEKQEILKNI